MNKLLILNNKKCQFVTEDLALFKLLHNHLSFKLTGVEYTPAYQNGWSGITYLMSKSGKFNYGLLSKVKTFLNLRKIEFKLEDQRLPKSYSKELDISESLKTHELIPRDHQLRILDAATKVDRGIIRAATGSGKTLAAALLTAKINKPTILYVIGLDLLDQFHNLFSKLFDEPIGYIGNGTCNIERINIASIWTVGRALKIDNIIDDENDTVEKDVNDSQADKIKSLLAKTKLHILDESHVVTTGTISEIYKHIEPEYIYGFSGTPFRDDNSDLLVHSILGEQIINISASELIKIGLLAQPLIKFYPIPKMTVSANYQSAYKEYITENDIRNATIIRLSKELIEKKYTPLVLFKQIKHGDILFDLMEEAGVRCSMLYGNDSLDKRNEVKKDLVDGNIDLILASTIFDIGLDLPKLSALVLAGGGKSSIRCLQRIGRILRPHENKKFAAVVDFYDQCKFLKKHSKVRYEIYKSEEGFKVFPTKEMKK